MGVLVEEVEVLVVFGGDEVVSGELRFEWVFEVFGNSCMFNCFDVCDDEVDENLGFFIVVGEFCFFLFLEFYVLVIVYIVLNMELVIVNWFCIFSKNFIISILL